MTELTGEIEMYTIERWCEYALGVTLFALLTGKPPFVGDANVVMLAHLSEPPPELRSQGIDAGLASLIERALSKDPADRPRDARAMSAVYVEGWRSHEAGPRLGITAENVRWRCSRGVRTLALHAAELAA